jgi:hypothetical protein
MNGNQDHILLGISDDHAATIDNLGKLLAQHKVIPFIGAGVSRQHLGFAGCGLASEMAKLLGIPPETPLSTLADIYIDLYGEADFANFLNIKLKVSELEDAKVPVHRLLLSLSARVVYTTNQDNLFELTATHYGRPYRRIVTLQDLSDAVPGERMLIKFHGDPEIPESLVFGARSYQQRIAAERHPFDIRLQSDLLGKQFLFIGYSLQDENVGKLLAAVNKIFGGKMPESYLLAYEYDPSMQDLSTAYGVHVINPVSFFNEPITAADAFERLLKSVCDSTIKYQTQQGVQTLFNEQIHNPRMVTGFELDALTKIVETETFESAIKAFRGLIDQTSIPTSMLDRCLNIFRCITERADPKKESDFSSLKGMLFNFRVPPSFAIQAMSFVMAACNQRPRAQGYDDFASLICPATADEHRPIAAAMAVTVLRERGETITDQFRHLATSWFQGFEEIPEPLLESVKLMIAEAWPGSMAPQSPLNRPQLSFRAKGFQSIMNDMTENLPKKFQTPAE